MSAAIPKLDALQGLMTLVEACHSVATPLDFTLNVYPRLVALLPHEMCVATVVQEQSQRLDYCLNLLFPDAYLRQVIGPDGVLRCPAFAQWRKILQPVFFELSAAPAAAFDPDWLRLANAHGIHNILAYGLAGQERGQVSFFTFAGVRQPRHTCLRRLRLIAPALHAAIVSIAQSESEPAPARTTTSDATASAMHLTSHMSERELEVLHWISRGKSTDETATILGISPWTVKAHVKHVLAKLQVTSRAQAVAKAFQLGLIT